MPPTFMSAVPFALTGAATGGPDWVLLGVLAVTVVAYVFVTSRVWGAAPQRPEAGWSSGMGSDPQADMTTAAATPPPACTDEDDHDRPAATAGAALPATPVAYLTRPGMSVVVAAGLGVVLPPAGPTMSRTRRVIAAISQLDAAADPAVADVAGDVARRLAAIHLSAVALQLTTHPAGRAALARQLHDLEAQVEQAVSGADLGLDVDAATAELEATHRAAVAGARVHLDGLVTAPSTVPAP